MLSKKNIHCQTASYAGNFIVTFSRINTNLFYLHRELLVTIIRERSLLFYSSNFSSLPYPNNGLHNYVGQCY
jgi:hypothetical protein